MVVYFEMWYTLYIYNLYFLLWCYFVSLWGSTHPRCFLPLIFRFLIEVKRGPWCSKGSHLPVGCPQQRWGETPGPACSQSTQPPQWHPFPPWSISRQQAEVIRTRRPCSPGHHSFSKLPSSLSRHVCSGPIPLSCSLFWSSSWVPSGTMFSEGVSLSGTETVNISSDWKEEKKKKSLLFIGLGGQTKVKPTAKRIGGGNLKMPQGSPLRMTIAFLPVTSWTYFALLLPYWGHPITQPPPPHNIPWSLVNAWSEVNWKSLSGIWLFVTLWTIQSMGFSRPDYWCG